MATELKVGMFTAFALLVLGYMLFVLSPDSFRSNSYITYYTEVNDAAGIVANTHVKTNGVLVGKVKSVKLLVNRSRIDIQVSEDVKIPVGSTIVIKEKGFLGDVFLEINRAKDTGEFLEDEAFIPPSSTKGSISDLIAKAGSIGDDIKSITANFAKVLGTKSAESDIQTIVISLRDILTGIDKMVAEDRAHINKLVVNLAEASDSVRTLVKNHDSDFNVTLANLRAATGDLKDFARAISEVMGEENKKKLGDIIASFDTTMQDVQHTAKDIRLVADKIGKGEGTLGRLISRDDTVTELEAAIKDVREVLAPVTKMQVQVDYHGEFRRSDNSQHYFDTTIRTRPDRFYVLGFTDKSETVRNITDVTTTNNGPAGEVITTETIKISEERALRFNLQFGKRWRNLQARFGLFESTGGFGLDYYFLDDRLKTSFEAFDWGKSTLRRTAHLKAYASLLFYKHVYALLGMDDVTRLDPVTGKSLGADYFVGGGLSFDDSDLKSILGSAAIAVQNP